MTIKQDIISVIIPMFLAVIMFLVSARVFPKAAAELHILISIMVYLAFYLRIQSIDEKHEILKAIEEGGCKK